MSEPALAIRDFNSGERLYVGVDPASRFYSVTSILDALPKHATLLPWAAGLVADRAIDYFIGGNSTEGAFDDIKTLRSWLASAWRENRDAAGDLGTEVHEAAEELLRQSDGIAKRYLNLLEVKTDSGEISQEACKRLALLGEFLEDHDVRVYDVEFTVFNDTHGYAGTCDLAATIDGVPYYLDIKTSKALRPDYAMQLTAYIHGEYCLDESRQRRSMPFEGTEIKGACIHLMKTKCKVVPVECGELMLDSFLSVLLVKRLWLGGMIKQALGTPMYDSKKARKSGEPRTTEPDAQEA